MAEVTIRWGVRAEGREVGETETVERTEYVEKLINKHRVTVVEGKKAAAKSEERDVESPDPPTARTPDAGAGEAIESPGAGKPGPRTKTRASE